ncbi:hypothetical protein O181_035974 [Austropuccinia psidii MF-1]|uniref:Uncharacterized protein n=1 Tax=Austropuccinia psidii MF-1 TaxID=1389203 RepID=A0A9Q3D3S3_9BASI|nr:hypothetical protein [Austropuccinia psidii MF-1]
MNFYNCLIFSFLISICVGSEYHIKQTPHLQKRAIPPALFRACHGGKISRLCYPMLDLAWKNGQLRFINGSSTQIPANPGKCSLTFWTEEKRSVQIDSVAQYKAALELVDEYCDKVGLSLPDPIGDYSGFSATFVGRLNGEYVVLYFQAH